MIPSTVPPLHIILLRESSDKHSLQIQNMIVSIFYQRTQGLLAAPISHEVFLLAILRRQYNTTELIKLSGKVEMV